MVEIRLRSLGIFVDQEFVGWGGLQHEAGEADLALVLHPKYWGSGKVIYQEIINRAFTTMGLSSITILLPPSRKELEGFSGWDLNQMANLMSMAFIFCAFVSTPSDIPIPRYAEMA